VVILLVFAGGTAAYFGVAACWGWFRPVRVTERALRALPATPVSQLRSGDRAKVTGRVVVRERLLSPFGGRICAYWTAGIGERADTNMWTVRAEQREGRGFWVDDGTARVWVDAEGETIPLRREVVGYLRREDDPSPQVAAAFVALGNERTRLFGVKHDLQFSEATLDQGEEVSVSGEVERAEIDGVSVLSLVRGEGGLFISDAPDVHD
jgi:hypothetical protein